VLAASLAALAFLNLPRAETFEADHGEVRALALRDGSAVSVVWLMPAAADVRTRMTRASPVWCAARRCSCRARPGKPFRVIVAT
jgi:hypothetical protein